MPRHDRHTPCMTRAERRRNRIKIDKLHRRSEQLAKLSGRKKRRERRKLQRLSTDAFAQRLQATASARPTEQKGQQWSTNAPAPAAHSAGHAQP